MCRYVIRAGRGKGGNYEWHKTLTIDQCRRLLLRLRAGEPLDDDLQQSWDEYKQNKEDQSMSRWRVFRETAQSIFWAILGLAILAVCLVIAYHQDSTACEQATQYSKEGKR